MATKQIYQLKITLQDIEPPIWRRILVPSTYDFWQLHCAIQDAFGWTDSHLHQFTYTDSYTDNKANMPIVFGIPYEAEFEDDLVALAGWQHKIDRYITNDIGNILYTYDFGDDWQHTIELEEILPYEKGTKYPRCLDGARACPPEDCGGSHGYAGLLETLFDPDDPEHEDTAIWADSMKGGKFEPEEFGPSKVKFTKPGWRLNRLLEYRKLKN